MPTYRLADLSVAGQVVAVEAIDDDNGDTATFELHVDEDMLPSILAQAAADLASLASARARDLERAAKL